MSSHELPVAQSSDDADPARVSAGPTSIYVAPIAHPTSAPITSHKNPAFSSVTQLLALCPLLAISDTLAEALGFSALVLVLLPLNTLIFSALRRWIDTNIGLPTTLLISAGLVTASDLLLQAWLHDLGASFGVFLPLLAVNALLVGPLFSPDATPSSLVIRSVRASIGIALTLIALGIARELVGRGSLLNGAGALLGSWARALEIKVFSVDMGFLLALLPPGAFISLGLLIAARHWWASRRSPRA